MYNNEVTAPGAIDTNHMISAVDLLPTLLDIAGIDHPDGFDGRSFLPTLRGEQQSGRDMVFKVYNENSGGNRSPMRSVQSKRFGYLFNPWSDGKRVFRTATTGTLSYRAMVKLAPTDPQIAARLELFQHGVPEEFYDYENDPDALVNLIDDPKYADDIATHRAAMRRFMVDSGDHALAALEHRSDKQFVSDYVDKVQAEADARRAKRRGNNAKTKPNPKLFQWQVPAQAIPGRSFTVSIAHRLPESLGEQNFHVTIKDAGGKRIERIVRSASGQGKLEVTFQIPERLSGKKISAAAFVGEEFSNNLMYRTVSDIKINGPANPQ
ncbi:hypothetical protein Mal15_16480 [Stieleria maiorica]|uniref:N-sulphoglucosamine sulphohydrolase C-terminal domain-containing protein n=1 Tax=Stieleria maiorica TaxID=2795974 RepID=A0A5B9MEJ3_9BACT|nr:sulfatase/phosphatase domain-containing protein [Stieleria maiorica]QEF97607.1 hypothetical protein Mal15_16480 [Stieleria maiorica]